MDELTEHAAPPARPGLTADLVGPDLQQAPRGFALVQTAGPGAQMGEEPGGLLFGVEARAGEQVHGRECRGSTPGLTDEARVRRRSGESARLLARK